MGNVEDVQDARPVEVVGEAGEGIDGGGGPPPADDPRVADQKRPARPAQGRIQRGQGYDAGTDARGIAGRQRQERPGVVKYGDTMKYGDTILISPAGK
jgi:hypothetical protein